MTYGYVFPDTFTGNPFFTPADLGARIQVSIADDDPTAILLSQLASDAVRDDLRLSVDLIVDDEITLYGDNGEIMLLPERPVTKVSSVILDNIALVPVMQDATSTLLMYDWRPDGRLYRIVYGGSFYAGELNFKWPTGVPVKITYSHGYQTVPSAFKSVALELAAAAYVNPEMHDQERVGWVEWATKQPGMTLTAAQRTALDVYRRLDF